MNVRRTSSNSQPRSLVDARVAALTARIGALELKVALIVEATRLKAELADIRRSIRPSATAADARRAAKRTETLANQVDVLALAVDAVSLLEKFDSRLTDAEVLLEPARGADSGEAQAGETRRLRQATKIIAEITEKLAENAKWIVDLVGLVARHRP